MTGAQAAPDPDAPNWPPAPRKAAQGSAATRRATAPARLVARAISRNLLRVTEAKTAPTTRPEASTKVDTLAWSSDSVPTIGCTASTLVAIASAIMKMITG